jgi:hypothetical protein
VEKDEIQTAEDLLHIIRNDVPKNAIMTMASGATFIEKLRLEPTTLDVNIDTFCKTALTAAEGFAKQRSNEPMETDAALLANHTHIPRLSSAVTKAVQSGKFKSVTKVTPQSEGAEA